MRAGVAAATGALAAMIGLAVLGAVLLGLGAGAGGAVLALAVGGPVSFTKTLPFGAGVEADITLMPLGVTVLGAVVLLAVLLRGGDVCVLAVRAGSAAVTFLALFAAVLPLLGTPPDVHIGYGGAVLGAVGWLVAVAAIGTACRVRAVRSVLLVLLGVVGGAVLAGAVAAIAGGARLLGTVLLGAPNLVLIAFTRGLGVPWPASRGLGPQVALPARIDAGNLQPLDAKVGVLTVFAVVVLLFCVGFALRDRLGGPFAGLPIAVLVPAGAALAGVSVRVEAGFGGSTIFGTEIGVHGELLPALGIGLGAGVVASLLVVAGRAWQARRS